MTDSRFLTSMESRTRGSNKHFLLMIELIKILDANFQPIKERLEQKSCLVTGANGIFWKLDMLLK